MKTKERVLVLETEVKALNAKVKKFETIMEAVGILFQQIPGVEAVKEVNVELLSEESEEVAPLPVDSFYGKIPTTVEEAEEIISKKVLSESHKLNIAKSKFKRVLDTETGMIHESLQTAAKFYGLNNKTLSAWLVGARPNKSPLKYVA